MKNLVYLALAACGALTACSSAHAGSESPATTSSVTASSSSVAQTEQRVRPADLRCRLRPAPIAPDTTGMAPNPEDELFAPHTLIIHYDTETGKEPLLQAVKDYDAELIYDYRMINAIAIRVPDSVDIHDAIRHFQQVKGVLQVSRDRKVQLM